MNFDVWPNQYLQIVKNFHYSLPKLVGKLRTSGIRDSWINNQYLHIIKNLHPFLPKLVGKLRASSLMTDVMTVTFKLCFS